MAPANVSPTPAIEDPIISVGTPRASTSASIGDIVWAARIDPTTNAPIEPVSSYSTNAPRITAVASTESLSPGLPVEATWEYNNTSLDAFSTQLMPGEMVDQAWIAFHIERESDTPWPAGVYEISISLNGTEMQHATVEVTG